MSEPVGTNELLSGEPTVVTAGVSLFTRTLVDQAVEVTAVDWRPPDGADDALVADLARVMADPRRTAANTTAAQRMLATGARLVDVRPAREVIGLEPGTFLHAGPPITWERASGPLRGALMGAMVFEGLASDPDEAEMVLEASAAPAGTDPGGGGIVLDSCHHHGGVGPMAGVVSPSMWVFELEDPASGRRAWCSLNEGLGKVLRYGAYGPEVIERLAWMSAVLGPLLQHAVRAVRDGANGPVDITAILAQMLQMGDEGHNRNRAGTLMLLRELLPAMVDGSWPRQAEVAAAVSFVAGNDHFFLNLGMPACKLITDAARGLSGSTVVVAMARNGTDFGIQTAGTGDTWFTGPANTPQGLYLGAYGPDDANPDIGDSAITETAGIGGFAMATAPAIVRFVGGDVPFALATTRRMYEITVAENPAFAIPVLEFRGTPTGIDVTSVVRTGILPQINTGMAGRVAGTGQVGAGLVTPPAEVFPAAVRALAELAPPLG
jgi:hypothetical protein